ncbi:MAG: N-acetylneuraminate synthase family protein [Candidatus Melainabacteria bacterium]|nr:N-acetylneuraminate synthase family protein [Candidatus Melainabacteria bacterium]
MGSTRRDEKMARTLIDVAVEAGCNAVKFQTYRPETTYVENAGESDYLSQAGIKESIRDIFADLAMPYEMVEGLATYCEALGITFMSSVFSVNDLEAVDPFTPVHKLASYEISHLRLIEAMAATRKPAILSTGASSPEDIDSRHKIPEHKPGSALLMKCTARYPAPLSALNLAVIPWMKARWSVPAGLSDHSRDPITGPLAAVALGANLIEKHYTLHNDLPGPDHKFAVTANELKDMVAAIRRTEEAVGDGVKRVHEEEEELYQYARRGVQAIRSIEAGSPLVEGENFAILRPGKQRRGMHPKNIERLQGARAQRLIPVGDGIGEDDVSY